MHACTNNPEQNSKHAAPKLILHPTEYYNKTITKLFGGNPRAGCYALAVTIFSLGIIRDFLYVFPFPPFPSPSLHFNYFTFTSPSLHFDHSTFTPR